MIWSKSLLQSRALMHQPVYNSLQGMGHGGKILMEKAFWI